MLAAMANARSARLTESELALWHAWKQATAVVMAGIEHALQARAELSGAEFGVLSRLVELGAGELGQQALADALNWHKSRLSHQLSRMATRGLLERRRDGGKLVRVRVTRRGRAAIARARGVHAAAVRACLLDAIHTRERARVLALLARLTGAA
jgi:DNA-binding MarR family transcriptional regulator